MFTSVCVGGGGGGGGGEGGVAHYVSVAYQPLVKTELFRGLVV